MVRLWLPSGEEVELTLLVAGDEDRLAAHVRREVVTGVRQLALVGEVVPRQVVGRISLVSKLGMVG